MYHRKLGIASIGDEICASLYGLYGVSHSYAKAQELDIFRPNTDLHQPLFKGMLKDLKNVPPKVCCDNRLE
jgi:hypothetical protein